VQTKRKKWKDEEQMFNVPTAARSDDIHDRLNKRGYFFTAAFFAADLGADFAAAFRSLATSLLTIWDF